LVYTPLLLASRVVTLRLSIGATVHLSKWPHTPPVYPQLAAPPLAP
jgi:hypothetical protein